MVLQSYSSAMGFTKTPKSGPTAQLYSQPGVPGAFVWDTKTNSWQRSTQIVSANKGVPEIVQSKVVDPKTGLVTLGNPKFNVPQGQVTGTSGGVIKPESPVQPGNGTINATGGPATVATPPPVSVPGIDPVAPGVGTTAAPAAGGGGNPEQASLLKQLMTEMQGKMDAANTANESRYQQGLAGYNDMLNNANTTLDSISGQAKKDIAQNYTNLGAQAQQNLVGRGLTGTSVPLNMNMKLASQQSGDLSRLADQTAQQRLQYQTGIQGDKLGFIERRNDVGPDYGQYLDLVKQYGDATGAGGASGVAAPASTGAPVSGVTGVQPYGGALQSIQQIQPLGAVNRIQPMNTVPSIQTIGGAKNQAIDNKFTVDPSRKLPMNYVPTYQNQAKLRSRLLY